MLLYEKFKNKEDALQSDTGIPVDIYFLKSGKNKVAIVDHTKLGNIKTCFPLICDVGEHVPSV
jgi:hypothetical protein